MSKKLKEIEEELQIAGDNYIEILRKYKLEHHASLVDTIKKSIQIQ